MSKEQKDDFLHKMQFGCGGYICFSIKGWKTVSVFLKEYLDHPEWEPRACQILGVKTEQEKIAEAVFSTDKLTKYIAIVASISILISLIVLWKGLFGE
ncbi:hypothetical protein ES705_50950 [subsurface metagenome]